MRYIARDPAEDPDVATRNHNTRAICRECGDVCSDGSATGLCIKCSGRRNANKQARQNREAYRKKNSGRATLYNAALGMHWPIAVVAEAARDKKRWRERLTLLGQTSPNGYPTPTNPESEPDLTIPLSDEITEAEAMADWDIADLTFIL